MKCAFCLREVKNTLAEYIKIIDGDCPSSCDDEITVKIRCPYCGRILFAKTIRWMYATWHKWPDFVEIIYEPEDEDLSVEDDLEDSFSVYTSEDGSEVIVYNKRTGDTIRVPGAGWVWAPWGYHRPGTGK